MSNKKKRPSLRRYAETMTGTYRDSAVAIKVYNPSVPEATKVNNSAVNGLYIYLLLLHKMFLYEAIIWKRLSHPNILPFLGLSDQSFPLCVVSPWMSHGNIREYLRSNPEINQLQLVCRIYACCI
jgi:serine/threonine protein kinase